MNDYLTVEDVQKILDEVTFGDVKAVAKMDHSTQMLRCQIVLTVWGKPLVESIALDPALLDEHPVVIQDTIVDHLARGAQWALADDILANMAREKSAKEAMQKHHRISVQGGRGWMHS